MKLVYLSSQYRHFFHRSLYLVLTIASSSSIGKRLKDVRNRGGNNHIDISASFASERLYLFTYAETSLVCTYDVIITLALYVF